MSLTNHLLMHPASCEPVCVHSGKESVEEDILPFFRSTKIIFLRCRRCNGLSLAVGFSNLSLNYVLINRISRIAVSHKTASSTNEFTTRPLPPKMDSDNQMENENAECSNTTPGTAGSKTLTQSNVGPASAFAIKFDRLQPFNSIRETMDWIIGNKSEEINGFSAVPSTNRIGKENNGSNGRGAGPISTNNIRCRCREVSSAFPV
ncbi:hypothetical protein Ddc_06847 [Ditylenchus destructor]|nr:hypothetical protein Ddc_06847 [Ditylenchus destructor]